MRTGQRTMAVFQGLTSKLVQLSASLKLVVLDHGEFAECDCTGTRASRLHQGRHGRQETDPPGLALLGWGMEREPPGELDLFEIRTRREPRAPLVAPRTTWTTGNRPPGGGVVGVYVSARDTRRLSYSTTVMLRDVSRVCKALPHLRLLQQRQPQGGLFPVVLVVLVSTGKLAESASWARLRRAERMILSMIWLAAQRSFALHVSPQQRQPRGGLFPVALVVLVSTEKLARQRLSQLIGSGITTD